MQKKYKYILIWLILFVALFTYNYFNTAISKDEIWNYGFSYNISNGLVPYRDFNMVLTPLYSFLLAGMIKIFGNSFFNLMILNSFIAALVGTIVIKRYGKKSLFLIPFVFFSQYNCYNFLSLFFFLIFIEKENTKYKDNEYLTGFIISLLLLTKQTVGGLLLIISFLYSKKKKDYLVGFLPLCIVLLVYLKLNNAIYQFFDYCLFGMLDFTKENSLSGINYTIYIYIIIISFNIYLLFKTRLKDKLLIYTSAFQIIAFPLLDFDHITIAIFPFLYYLVDNKNVAAIIKSKSIINYSFIFLSFYLFSLVLVYNVMYLYNTNSYIYHNKNSFLNNVLISFDISFTHEIENELIKNYSEYTKYFLTYYGYIIKLENNHVTNKYDLINNGNMGYKGEDKYINEIDTYCRNNKCLILLENDISKESQTNRKITNYYAEKYNYQKSIYGFDIYINQS